MNPTRLLLASLLAFTAACSLTTDLDRLQGGVETQSESSVSPDCAGVSLDDGLECTIDSCADGAAVHSPVTVGQRCGSANRGHCDASGVCAECLASSDCNELPGCVGDGCICNGGLCTPLHCSNEVVDGDESDVDCGGAECPLCPDNAACHDAGDCASGVCNLMTARCSAPTCDDGVANGDESDVDCGGSCPAACDIGSTCGVGGDCVSKVCNALQHVCVAPSCEDLVQNGSESDVDCGGSCEGCGLGKKCNFADDCKNSNCEAGICKAGQYNGEPAWP